MCPEPACAQIVTNYSVAAASAMQITDYALLCDETTGKYALGADVGWLVQDKPHRRGGQEPQP